MKRASRSIALPSPKLGLTRASGAGTVRKSDSTWQATNTESPAPMAGAYPAIGCGILSVVMPSLRKPYSGRMAMISTSI